MEGLLSRGLPRLVLNTCAQTTRKPEIEIQGHGVLMNLVCFQSIAECHSNNLNNSMKSQLTNNFYTAKLQVTANNTVSGQFMAH